MKRILIVGVLVLAGGALLMAAGALGWTLHRYLGKDPLTVTPLPRDPGEARILATLRRMEETGNIQFGVPESDGRRLRLLAEALGAKSVVEVGTSTGYSGLWLCLGVRASGGHLTTFEIDAGRAARARDVFRQAGVDRQVTVVVGDAHHTLAGWNAPIDLIFLDADKQGYPDYLEKLLPFLRPGGLILAHNVEDAPAYVERVAADSTLDTVALTQGSGLSATLRKR